MVSNISKIEYLEFENPSDFCKMYIELSLDPYFVVVCADRLII